jgi:hypothetical protein
VNIVKYFSDDKSLRMRQPGPGARLEERRGTFWVPVSKSESYRPLEGLGGDGRIILK